MERAVDGSRSKILRTAPLRLTSIVALRGALGSSASAGLSGRASSHEPAPEGNPPWRGRPRPTAICLLSVPLEEQPS